METRMGIVQKTFVVLQSGCKWASQDVVKKWFLFVFVSVFALNVLNVFAADDDYKIDINENYNQSDLSGTAATGDKERNVDKTVEFQVYGGAHSALKTFCGLETCFKIKDENALSQLSPLMRKGLIGIATDNMMALMTNPPTVNVAGHLAQEWIPGYDLSNSTYAADSGYQYLVEINISDLWETVRTIAYVIFVVILIIAGFMIMFRHKIGGQMAVTIFNSLPNVVLGLIMATFSFALVGIMIDIGAILVTVVASVLKPSGQHLTSVNQPFALYDVFLGKNTSIFAEAMANSVKGFDVSDWMGFALALLAIFGTGGLLAILIGIVVAVIIGYASIKVYITLLKAYLGILLDTIASPVIWALASLPGYQNFGWEWLKRVAKNILTFPMVFFFVNLGVYVLSTNVSIGFPAGLTGGDVSANGTGDSLVGLAIKFCLPLILMFMAAESPKLLEDLFPATGGKGAASAIEGVGKSFSKFFGG